MFSPIPTIQQHATNILNNVQNYCNLYKNMLIIDSIEPVRVMMDRILTYQFLYLHTFKTLSNKYMLVPPSFVYDTNSPSIVNITTPIICKPCAATDILDAHTLHFLPSINDLHTLPPGKW
jgi:hypothetical protein